MQGLPTATLSAARPLAYRWYWRLLSLLFCILLLPTVSAAELVIIDGSQEQIPLSGKLQSLRDPDSKFTPQSLLQAETAANWSPAIGKAVNQGIDRSDWWFRVDIRNDKPKLEKYLLEIAYSSLDYIGIYIADGSNIIEQQFLGDRRPFYDRPINHHYFVLPTTWPAGETRTLLIHIKTNGVVQLPISLWQESAFSSHDQARQLIMGTYFGAMLVMMIYNLFMFIGIRERSYFYYVLFVLSVPLFVASLNGYSFQYFWPEATIWNGQSIGFFLSTMVLSSLLFTYDFLHLKRESTPKSIRLGMSFLLLLSLFMLGSVFMASYNAMLIITISGAVIICCGALLIGLYGSMQGERAALLYVFAWGSLLISGLILAASKLTLLPQNIFVDNAVQVGSTLLVVLLSFALAERINHERRQRYQAQMEALENERQARLAQGQALNAQQQANLQLESKVAQRTEELAKANAILQELSNSDALTGLRNRRYLDDYLNREIGRSFRHQHPLALILLDIDHFKPVNDNFGHHVGDECLRIVAEQLRHCVTRDSDVIARYGGEEFCIVLPETEMEGAYAVAERVRKRIAKTPIKIADEDIAITISVGVTTMVPSSPTQYSHLLQRADEALYQSKNEGRNRTTCLPA